MNARCAKTHADAYQFGRCAQCTLQAIKGSRTSIIPSVFFAAIILDFISWLWQCLVTFLLLGVEVATARLAVVSRANCDHRRFNHGYDIQIQSRQTFFG